ncbi:hypothetical protein [Ruegeria sp. HU-ET01832]
MRLSFSNPRSVVPLRVLLAFATSNSAPFSGYVTTRGIVPMGQ